MFGSIGFQELLVILLIILLLFGAKRLPELARALGKGIQEFKKAASDIQSQADREDASGKDAKSTGGPASRLQG